MEIRRLQHFHSGSRHILRESDFDEAFDASLKKMLKNFDEFVQNGSGWIFESVQHLYMKYEPIRGSIHIETPKAIAGKHAINNPHNTDEMC